MLTELNISNFAIIDKIRIEFKEGLNVISGETGAGKSIILKSLSLLMGQKAIPGIIKSGFGKPTSAPGSIRKTVNSGEEMN